jgi:hypothetical protein
MHLMLLALATACHNAAETPMFSEEKSARIMADLYLAEAATNGYTGYSKDSLTHVYYDQVLKIHGITASEYEQNLQVLAQDERRIERVVNLALKLIDPKAELPENNEEEE